MERWSEYVNGRRGEEEKRRKRVKITLIA